MLASVTSMQAGNKDEVQDILNELMKQPGVIGYVLINFDGESPSQT